MYRNSLSKLRTFENKRKIMISKTEENYLKAIFKLSEASADLISTNAIAQAMDTSAASVTDMISRLASKDLIHYKKHRGCRLKDKGIQLATNLVRKHRLWETFLVEKTALFLG